MATITMDTCPVVDGAHFTIPIKQEYPEINAFKLDTSRYTYFIDSTIIHTNFTKREEIHNTFKNNRNYRQYEINDILKYPSKIAPLEIPTYVIEHFVRITNPKSSRHTRAYTNDINAGEIDCERMRSIEYKFPANIAIFPWHARKERDHRIEIFQGLTPIEKEFYSPDYSNAQLPKQDDRRRTLYWNPNVKTDSLGQARIVFYTNGTTNPYKMEIQGVTTEGQFINKYECVK